MNQNTFNPRDLLRINSLIIIGQIFLAIGYFIPTMKWGVTALFASMHVNVSAMNMTAGTYFREYGIDGMAAVQVLSVLFLLLPIVSIVIHVLPQLEARLKAIVGACVDGAYIALMIILAIGLYSATQQSNGALFGLELSVNFMFVLEVIIGVITLVLDILICIGKTSGYTMVDDAFRDISGSIPNPAGGNPGQPGQPYQNRQGQPGSGPQNPGQGRSQGYPHTGNPGQPGSGPQNPGQGRSQGQGYQGSQNPAQPRPQNNGPQNQGQPGPWNLGQPTTAPQANLVWPAFCSNCGAKVTPGAKFCAVCGKPIQPIRK